MYRNCPVGFLNINFSWDWALIYAINNAVLQEGLIPMSTTETPKEAAPAFRIDVGLHDLLKEGHSHADIEDSVGYVEGGLPEPSYPQHPDPEIRWKTESQLNNFKRLRVWKALGAPYFKSRMMPWELRPLISYLFTEWKCNLDCHYCWSYDNSIKGMTEPVAKRSIDWLHETGNRFLALMGGEPLLRPNFIHKVVDYATKKDFLVYLPTNGRLMKPDVIDRLGDAGLATINLAVDTINEKPGLAKALAPIRPYFDYALKVGKKYQMSTFFNVCICRTNMNEVRELTNMARDLDIGIDFHIVESPLIDSPHFKHLNENSTFLTPADYPAVDDLIDWIVEQQAQGVKVVNQRDRLLQMKTFMRGHTEPWGCKAGINTLIVRTDGTLAAGKTMSPARRQMRAACARPKPWRRRRARRAARRRASPRPRTRRPSAWRDRLHC
jgi:MoaA/NifB/PqqE/SkfB family radical SAM enzyme